MSNSVIYKPKSFWALILTHCFTVFNDNFFKVVLIFFLLKQVGSSKSYLIFSSASLIFVLPFLFLVSVAGGLADRYRKSFIIFCTRVVEVIATILGAVCFYYKCITGAYFVLLIMACHSAIFTPAKFGILPEFVTKEKLSLCNAIMVGATYISLILGTFFASFLVDITQDNFFLVSLLGVFLAILGFLSSLLIQRSEIRNSNKKISWLFWIKVIESLKNAKKTEYLCLAMIASSFFIFLGTYVHLNLLTFVETCLKKPAVVGGYLFLSSSLGMSLAILLMKKKENKEIRLKKVPFWGIGIGIALIGLYFFQCYISFITFFLFVLGFCAIAYVSPLHAFIQFVSEEKERGQNLATANFLDFLGVLGSSVIIFLFGHVFHLNEAKGFLFVGIATILLMIKLLFKF